MKRRRKERPSRRDLGKDAASILYPLPFPAVPIKHGEEPRALCAVVLRWGGGGSCMAPVGREQRPTDVVLGLQTAYPRGVLEKTSLAAALTLRPVNSSQEPAALKTSPEPYRSCSRLERQ